MEDNRKKTVHIISHTHWDREWYLNSKFVNRWIPIFFDALFEMMEKEPEYRFVLDGQTSILDDCYGELERNGQDVDAFQETLKMYVEEGRIILGPYYLQPDWQLISGEALVRNMLYGKQMSEEMGGGTTTGWLLDNFGQISQAPQIHKQFGMNGIVVWRGVEFEPEQLNSEFEWQSPDGTVLPCVYLLSSYRNAMRLADCPDIIYSRIRNEAEKIAPFATTGNVLLMNGYDQEMNPDDILPYLKDGQADFGDFMVKQSSPDDYMKAVIAELKCPRRFSGPLYSGRYISVFPGILSCRMYLKVKNDQVQRKLEQQAEPLRVMALVMGGKKKQTSLDPVWKRLLKNHPHDSICGVSVDDVHTDMEDRLDAVDKELDCCVADSVQEIAARIDTTAFKDAKAVFHIINTCPMGRICNVCLPWSVEQDHEDYEVRDQNGAVYETQKTAAGLLTLSELPAFGYQTLGMFKTLKQERRLDASLGKTGLPVLENAWIRVDFNSNGSFTLTDKRNMKTYKNMGYLEDCADSGDEYNFSDLENDVPRTTLQEQPEITVVEEGALCTVVKVSYIWKLPAELSFSRKERSRAETPVPITTFVTLFKSSPAVHCKTVLRNRCKDHRIRVMFPTGVKTAESLAQTQFDVTAHPVTPNVFDNSKIPEDVKRIIIGARESRPITQFPQREFVAVSDGTAGVAVFNQGLPEYEVLENDTTIAVTLFRSVGWLARTDLNTRIGDAGPEIFTPDAQCLRDMEFSYDVYPMSAGMDEERLMEQCAAIHQLPLVVKSTVHEGSFQAECGFFHVTSKADIRITAVKEAQDGNGVILRLFHAGEREEQVQISADIPVLEVYETNLAEENLKKLIPDAGKITFPATPKRIKTVRLIFDINVRDSQEIPGEGIRICTPYELKDTFEEYQMPDVVTIEEIESEANRASEMERAYKLQAERYESRKKDLVSVSAGIQEQKELADLRMKTEALHRAALESRLSWLYTWKKHRELIMGRKSREFAAVTQETDADIQKLADQLNLARIEKRVSEYAWDFYTQREKEEALKEE